MRCTLLFNAVMLSAVDHPKERESVHVMSFDEVMAKKKAQGGSTERVRRRSRSPPHHRRPDRDRHDDRFRDRNHDRVRSHDGRRHSQDRRDYRDDRRSQQQHREHRDRRRDRHSESRRDRDGRRLDHQDRKGKQRHKEPEKVLVDPVLRPLDDDPRAGQTTRQTSHGKGMNTESFDPASTLVRPQMRVHVGSARGHRWKKELKHDDIVIVPEFFCAEDDWSMYYKLVEEMRALQAEGKGKDTAWIPWHEGCHLVTKGPDESPTFKNVLKSAAEYFGIKLKSVGTRFNWYRDGKDWKPFHHDSAAFNPHRARNQNITVGLSFGDERELAFLHVDSGARYYFPQCNGAMFSFGRDVNINFKHGWLFIARSRFLQYSRR